MNETMAWAKRFVDDIITSPLNICLVALICYFSYKLIRKDTINTTSNKKRSTSVVKKRLEDMPKQDFTLEQLREYDGVKSSGRLLIGVLGRVFDVSSASEFYGPGGPYSVFAGRDASRALATFSVDPTQFKDTYDDLSDLNTSQLGSVKEWEMQFLEKYNVVGKLLKAGEEPTDYSEQTTTTSASSSSNDSKDSTTSDVPNDKKEL